MRRNKKKVLYFISGAMPTDAQYKEAEGHQAAFRNATHCGKGVNLEACDVAMGDVPEGYKKMEGVEILKSKIENDPDEPTTGGATKGSKPWDAGATPSFLEAVAMLDKDNEDHWTTDGRPDCHALASVANLTVSASERDSLWAEQE